MHNNETVITPRGQVTIPVEVRRALGLHPRDRVCFEVDPKHGVATLRPAPSAIRALFGAVRAPRDIPDDMALRQAMERLIADEVMSEKE